MNNSIKDYKILYLKKVCLACLLFAPRALGAKRPVHLTLLPTLWNLNTLK